MGIEQRIRNILLNDKTLTDAMKKISKKDDVGDVGIYVNNLPDGDLDNFPYILISIKSLKESLFYDDESHAWDVALYLGIGTETYKDSLTLSNLAFGVLRELGFSLVESDSFNDTENNLIGSRMTVQNKLFSK